MPKYIKYSDELKLQALQLKGTGRLNHEIAQILGIQKKELSIIFGYLKKALKEKSYKALHKLTLISELSEIEVKSLIKSSNRITSSAVSKDYLVRIRIKPGIPEGKWYSNRAGQEFIAKRNSSYRDNQGYFYIDDVHKIPKIYCIMLGAIDNIKGELAQLDSALA